LQKVLIPQYIGRYSTAGTADQDGRQGSVCAAAELACRRQKVIRGAEKATFTVVWTIEERKAEMERASMYFVVVLTSLLVAGWMSTSALAQDEMSLERGPEDDAKAALKADKTGTNPINFTYDARIYNEFQWLNTDGDGEQNITTFEFRTPFADGRWQFRLRARYNSIEADLNDDGSDDVDEDGLGDFDFRFLTVPYMNMQKRRALAVGFETFLDTASEDELGSGATSFGPQVFGVFFAPLGIPGHLVAPAYQHKFSVEEDDDRDPVHQGLIDIFVLWTSKDKQYWGLLDPQIILDYQQDTEYMIVDAELGMMLDEVFGTKGQSVYIRPAFGVGSDRPIDASIEVGYKVIW
jgi:hypothetical protein